MLHGDSWRMRYFLDFERTLYPEGEEGSPHGKALGTPVSGRWATDLMF